MVFTRTFRQWAGRRRQGNRIGRVAHFIKHTEAGANMPTDATVEMELRRLRAIDALHKTRFGKRGFGYSWASFPSGRVYEGRGEHRSGAHTVGFNHSALASMHAGHGDRTPMTRAAINADRAVIAQMQARGALARDYRVSGHRDHAAKSCPGNLIYPQLPELRGVTPDETTPEPEEDELPLNDDDVKRIAAQVWRYELGPEGHRQPAGNRLFDVDVHAERAARHGDAANNKLDRMSTLLREGVRAIAAKLGLATEHDPPDRVDA